jgi:hypothetical protein
MYHPYFRGKQYELIAVRETAPVLAKSNFVPIIEPVRESLGGLERTLKALCDIKGTAIVIVNPYHGDHSDDGDSISLLLKTKFLGRSEIAAGILLTKEMSAASAVNCYEEHKNHRPTFVHAGFSDPKGFASSLGRSLEGSKHIFFEEYCGKLYRRHFLNCERVLLRDGFKARRNRDHPLLEPFSDLHITYPDEGVDSFGDFLIVGDEYSETGGPAYAVAIHLTFIDPDNDDAMYIYHFISQRKDTPTDPAGKFAEALAVMIKTLNKPDSKILETEAVREFRELYAKKHFPGLGYVKKLSMKHHIETLADFLG